MLRDEKLSSRRGYETIPAIDPFDGREWDIRVAHARMDAVVKRGPGYAKELAFVLPEILLFPTAIFQGVREEGEREWLCYCGVPTHAFQVRTGHRIAPHLGEVYLVYVNSDRVAYNSRWEKCDEANIDLPDGYDDSDRFDKRLQ